MSLAYGTWIAFGEPGLAMDGYRWAIDLMPLTQTEKFAPKQIISALKLNDFRAETDLL